MEPVRLRLIFEDGHMLNKSHRKNGLKRSWILLQPNHHKTIQDFASYLTCLFDLHLSCPKGLVLSMDGFVLPFFESTCVLKDKDLICVKKKNGTICAKVEEHEQEIVEKQPLDLGIKLLGNEESSKETKGYKSKSEEDYIQPKDSLQAEDAVQVNVVSKKRKASGKLGSSEKKKKKRTTDVSPGTPEVDVDIEHELQPKKNVLRKRRSSDVKVKEEKIITEICTRGDANDCSMLSNKRSHLLAKGTDLVNVPEESKKVPSRSARRKKAKRQWLRQSSMLEKKELNSLPISEKDNHQSSQKSNHQSSEKCDHLLPEKHNDQSPKKRNHQSPKKDSTLSSKEEIHMDTKQESQSSDAEEEVVPVVVRPGHIRFEPLGKGLSHPRSKTSAVQQNESPVDNFQWNGITSKKRGQKWGSEKGTYNGRSADYIFKYEDTEMRIPEEKAPSCPDPIDFDKLMPYAGLPERGDLIAYRLIELSSSWCPEVSPFRVGKISQYDSETGKVTLESVPEYPLVPEKKFNEEEEEESAPQLDTYLYGEDGSLEIDFPSLIDVRIVKNGNPNAAKKVTAIVNGHANDKKTMQNTTSIGNSKGKKNVAPAENGGAATWDEISEALSAKKAQLSQQNNWQKNENSSHERQLPYRVLRGSALGPTMAILRDQNAL